MVEQQLYVNGDNIPKFIKDAYERGFYKGSVHSSIKEAWGRVFGQLKRDISVDAALAAVFKKWPSSRVTTLAGRCYRSRVLRVLRDFEACDGDVDMLEEIESTRKRSNRYGYIKCHDTAQAIDIDKGRFAKLIVPKDMSDADFKALETQFIPIIKTLKAKMKALKETSLSK